MNRPGKPARQVQSVANRRGEGSRSAQGAPGNVPERCVLSKAHMRTEGYKILRIYEICNRQEDHSYTRDEIANRG